MEYKITIRFMNEVRHTVVIFYNKKEADDYMKRTLSGLLSDGYKAYAISDEGMIYSKGFWFWKKQVLINYTVTETYREESKQAEKLRRCTNENDKKPIL